jgi:hypothetical protein
MHNEGFTRPQPIYQTAAEAAYYVESAVNDFVNMIEATSILRLKNNSPSGNTSNNPGL